MTDYDCAIKEKFYLRRNGCAVLWKRKVSVSRKNIRLRISAKLILSDISKKTTPLSEWLLLYILM
ncbi:hypothetical protein PUR_24880 [Paenibacillus sp. URB8-2]|nr:hypothetical protein PUR_24880 [Paenibacillus sp. URB8-2]